MTHHTPPLQLRPAPVRLYGVPHYLTTDPASPIGVYVDYAGDQTVCSECGATVRDHRSTCGARNGYATVGHDWDSPKAPARVLCSRCVDVVR